MNKPKASVEKKKALKAMSDYIRERDGWTCFTCGKGGDKYSMDAGHLITSTRAATLFDELNVHCQCKGCNIKHEHDYETYRKKFVDVYGEEVYDDLYEGSFAYVGRRAADYALIREMFEDKLRKLKGE
jgi:rubredoxin